MWRLRTEEDSEAFNLPSINDAKPTVYQPHIDAITGVKDESGELKYVILIKEKYSFVYDYHTSKLMRKIGFKLVGP